ncbi:MAG: tyrosine-protein phosphatase [Planctomycetota bacterium]|jgi:protein tyrosine/serine phosphatase
MSFLKTLNALRSKLFGSNLHAVEKGRLYRVARGRMSTPDFKILLSELKIKTAVDLRRAKTSAADDLTPADFEAAGVRFENVHLRSSALPFPAKLSRFVDIVDGLTHPALFYCKRGTDKTGFSSMLYLMLVNGTSWEEAKAQLAFIPFGHKKKRHTGPWEFMRLLRECAPIHDLRAWIRNDYPALFKRERGDEEERALAEEGAG